MVELLLISDRYVIRVIYKRGYIYGSLVNINGMNSSSNFANSLSGQHHKCWGKFIRISDNGPRTVY